MDWHNVLAAVLAHIDRHHEAYTVLGTTTAIAAARHMPEQIPNSFQALYTWFRSSVQEVVNQKSGTTQPAAAPPPPAEPRSKVI